MDFDLRSAIDNLDQSSVYEIANGARPANDYLFNAILPNRNMETYDVDGGSLTIRTTMAGLSGMDSKYNEGGAAEQMTFSGKTAKITISSYLPEAFLRRLQSMLLRLTAQSQPTDKTISDTGINFVNKIIVQALLDREEWLKGQALFTGGINWTFNGKTFNVDYGIDSKYFLTARTGNDAYGGSSSKFWDDYYEAQDLLNWNITAIITHPTTLKAIMANATVNQLQFVSSDPTTGIFQFARLVDRYGNTQVSTDPRDFISIIAYNRESEIWDLANPGQTEKVPFCPLGAMLYVGAKVEDNSFVVGEGGTDAPLIDSPVQIGYGHVAPTTEGGGLPGRWARLYVPENTPWSLAADGVENFMPVLWAKDRIVVATTELS